MRTMIIAILAITVGILSIPLYLIELAIRFFDEKKAARAAQWVVRIVFRLVLFISGAKITVVGKERIPKDTTVLYAANHRSFFDILLAYSEVPTLTAFVSKKEIKKLPCVAQWMYFLNCLFIDRGDIKQQMQVIKTCIRLVEEGYSIYIAPEGTRNATDSLLPFKEGSFRIATKTNCPVIPVCIQNTETMFENVLPWIRKGSIKIEFGDPIYLDTLESEQKKHLGAFVQTKVAKMYTDKS